MIEFFDRIEMVNKDSQMSELWVIDSYRKVEAVILLVLKHSMILDSKLFNKKP